MDIEYESGDSLAIIDNIINILSPLSSREVFPCPLKYGLEYVGSFFLNTPKALLKGSGTDRLFVSGAGISAKLGSC